VLVVGPWKHGDWVRLPPGGPQSVPSDAAGYYREHIVFPFFERFLRGSADPHLPEADVFETGRNVWRTYDAWPPKDRRETTIYLRANGKLAFEPPGEHEGAYDEYVSDPASPVRYVPYAATDLAPEFMTGDQRFAAKRPDVLTYVSDPLTAGVTVAGPVSPRLQVSTSGTDADFDVKLIDVFPGEGTAAGSDQLVRGEPMRARFRTSRAAPEAMTPNQITPVAFEMPDVLHTFLRGHRIMVQIQSSWFPLTDLNPQTFVDAARAKSSDFVKATERVYHTPAAASGIVLGILPH